jgi:hypothetical protein
MDNPEKLSTLGTKDEEIQNKNTTQYGHHYTQTSTNNVNKTSAFLQTTGSKDEPTIICGNRNRHLNRCTWSKQAVYKYI